MWVDVKNTGYKIGDIISFKFKNGENIQAMAVKQEDDGMLFCSVNCLAKQFAMHDSCFCENYDKFNYERTSLRRLLNTKILDYFTDDIKSMLVPFKNGDMIRLPTEREIFGDISYDDSDDPYVQWVPMKQMQNRCALLGDKSSIWARYWLQNRCRDYEAVLYFVNVMSDGFINHAPATSYYGIRIVFKLK